MSIKTTWPFHVVLLPGFGCDDRLFEAQIDMFDHLGVDWSFEPLTRGVSIREFAVRVLRFSNRPLALIGLSMGGIVALNVARVAPERIVSLSLLNTTPFADQMSSLRKAQIKRVRNGALSTILRAELVPKYLSENQPGETVRELAVEMGEAIGPDVFVQQSIALMTRRSMMAGLSNISCPTLIISGEHDRVCPPQISKTMYDLIPKSELFILPDCGHLSTLDAPMQVNSLLNRHLTAPRTYESEAHSIEAFL